MTAESATHPDLHDAGTAVCVPEDGLRGLISPLDEKRFLASHLGVRPLLCRGTPDRFADVFGWDALNALLASTRVDPSRMHLVRAARGIGLASCAEPVPQLAPRGRPTRLRPDALTAALADGATLAVDGAEELHPPLRTLVRGVEDSLRNLVQANLYANLGGAPQGFDTHWDDHDVIILQVAGSKNWDLRPPTLSHPVGELTRPPKPLPSDPGWSGTLTAGDVLYLPRGWWHTVRAADGPSLHLTLSSRLPSAADLLRRLLRRLATEQPVVRQDLPRFADPETADRWYADLRTALVDAVREPGLLERLAEEAGERAPARPEFTLPECPR
ncbi:MULTISPECIES: JmjC domain-containing protein [unclassified Streptomyces]|uniref:JmjC domain-containing protein n=1 Tax=unclassified Streptomyces TaxID=2593676 RepID=UPI00068BCF7A